MLWKFIDKYFLCDVFVLNLHMVVDNICVANFDMYEIYWLKFI